MTKNFREWIAEGEQLYSQAINEFSAIEQQLEALEQQLSTKKDEVNEIARVVGKPAVDSSRRLSAELVEAGSATPAGSMARALTGRGLAR